MPLSALASPHSSLRRPPPCGSRRYRAACPRRPRRARPAETRTEPETGSSATAPRGRRDRSRRCVTSARACAARPASPPSRREPLATLAAPALDDLSAAARTHPRAEPVSAGALSLLGLIRPLHDRRGSIGVLKMTTPASRVSFFAQDAGSRTAGPVSARGAVL